MASSPVSEYDSRIGSFFTIKSNLGRQLFKKELHKRTACRFYLLTAELSMQIIFTFLSIKPKHLQVTNKSKFNSGQMIKFSSNL